MRVLKFGGATIADPQKILNAAQRVAAHVRRGEKIIVVVSAMGKTTSELIALAKAVSPHPHRREMDMLLSVGERITMSLLSMALNDLDIPAVSLTGSQSGIITTEDHENAEIIAIKPIRIKQYLDEGKTVIVAGFQGVSEKTKEITTLGRGGSDTTAVALASHFQCPCEILKEMDSVFTADPRYFPSAKKVHEVSYDVLKEMTFWGAKMLNSRAAHLAHEHQVELFFGPAMLSSTEDSSEAKSSAHGTRVCTTANSDQFLFINHHPCVLRLEILNNQMKLPTSEWIQKKFYELSLHSPQILLVEPQGSKTEVWISAHEDSSDLARKTLMAEKSFLLDSETYSTLSFLSKDKKHSFFFRIDQMPYKQRTLILDKDGLRNDVLFFYKKDFSKVLDWFT